MPLEVVRVIRSFFFIYCFASAYDVLKRFGRGLALIDPEVVADIASQMSYQSHSMDFPSPRGTMESA